MVQSEIDIVIILGVVFLLAFSLCCCFIRSWYIRMRNRRIHIAKEKLIDNINKSKDINVIIADAQNDIDQQNIYKLKNKLISEGKQNNQENNENKQAHIFKIIKHGILKYKFKQNKSYKKQYYFMLSNAKLLLYYKSKKDSFCKGTINLKIGAKINKLSNDNETEFVLKSDGKTWYFDSCYECRDDWYNALSEYCLDESVNMDDFKQNEGDNKEIINQNVKSDNEYKSVDDVAPIAFSKFVNEFNDVGV